MKTKTFILICLTLFGCDSSSDTAKENIDTQRVMTNKLEYIDTPNEYFGLWVNEEYLKSLRQTKSTKKASEKGVDG